MRINKPVFVIGALVFTLGTAMVACPSHAGPRVIWGGSPDVNGGQGQPMYVYYPPGQTPGAGAVQIGGLTILVGSVIPGIPGKVVTVIGGGISAWGLGTAASQTELLTAPPAWYFRKGSTGSGGSITISTDDASTVPISGDIATNKDAFRVRPTLRRVNR